MIVSISMPLIIGSCSSLLVTELRVRPTRQRLERRAAIGAFGHVGAQPSNEGVAAAASRRRIVVDNQDAHVHFRGWGCADPPIGRTAAHLSAHVCETAHAAIGPA